MDELVCICKYGLNKFRLREWNCIIREEVILPHYHTTNPVVLSRVGSVVVW